MASSNRLQITSVEEVTLGTTPATPRMRTRLVTGEALKYAPTFDSTDELRSDGMTGDDILTGADSNGTINFNINYPFPGTPWESDLKSAFRNPFVSTPSRDNDGTADSVITDIGTTTDTVACTTGAAFVAGHLVRFNGNTNSANDGVRKCTTGSATAPVFASSGFVADAAPAATSRMKVVGIQGASGDITAVAGGLASTALDFTTFPELFKGKWIKIGGTAAGDQFATAALNASVRITAITAHLLTCDNLPSGWTTDAGTGKTIKIWTSDQIKNGVTDTSQTIERGHLGQGTPTYIVQPGMVATQLALSFAKKKKFTGVVTFMGMVAPLPGTSSLDASPDAAPAQATYPVFAGSSNVGRIGEAGATLTSPNWVESLDLNINNNATAIEAVDTFGPAGIVTHEGTVTGKMNTYFGSNALLLKFFAGTPSAINLRATKGAQQMIWSLPRITYNGDGSPNATGKNQNVMLGLSFKASKDEAVTNAQVLLDRFEYVE